MMATVWVVTHTYNFDNGGSSVTTDTLGVAANRTTAWRIVRDSLEECFSSTDDAAPWLKAAQDQRDRQTGNVTIDLADEFWSMDQCEVQDDPAPASVRRLGISRAAVGGV